MRFLAPVLIVLILVVGVLIALAMNRRSNRKKEEWRALTYRATLAEATIRKIDQELDVAKSAGMDLEVFLLDNIISEYTAKRETPNVKEIAR